MPFLLIQWTCQPGLVYGLELTYSLRVPMPWHHSAVSSAHEHAKLSYPDPSLANKPIIDIQPTEKFAETFHFQETWLVKNTTISACQLTWSRIEPITHAVKYHDFPILIPEKIDEDDDVVKYLDDWSIDEDDDVVKYLGDWSIDKDETDLDETWSIIVHEDDDWGDWSTEDEDDDLGDWSIEDDDDECWMVVD